MVWKLTVIQIRHREGDEEINKELQWLGNSLGLFNLRDKDSSCFRVFIILVRKARQNAALSSDEIAERLHLSRGTVVHHLTKLMESGIVVREREGYLLRESHLARVIQNLRRDMESVFTELEQVAQDIDGKLG